MKKIILSLFLFSAINVLFSQDLIITQSNDSIECTISEITDNSVFFIMKESSQNMVLPLSQLKSYHFNYVPVKATSNESAYYPTYRIGLQGGYGYQIGKQGTTLTAAETEYVRKLKSGYFLAADYHYYLREALGVGLMGSFYNASNSESTIVEYEGQQYTGENKDKIRVFYVGPSFSFRLFNNDQKHAILVNASIGYLNFKDKYKRGLNSANDKVSTAAGVVGVGYDYRLASNVSLGLQVSCLISFAKEKGNAPIQTDSKLRNLCRFELGVGIRFLPKED